jgi:hypothetical protein
MVQLTSSPALGERIADLGHADGRLEQVDTMVVTSRHGFAAQVGVPSVGDRDRVHQGIGSTRRHLARQRDRTTRAPRPGTNRKCWR